MRPHQRLNPVLPTWWRGSCHGANSPMNCCVFISILQNRVRTMSSAHTTNAKKNLVGVASADRTERTTALLRAKNQKSINVINRHNHCAIGTLNSELFGMLHLKSCYSQKPLSLIYSGMQSRKKFPIPKFRQKFPDLKLRKKHHQI
jgi:hypothetical protein